MRTFLLLLTLALLPPVLRAQAPDSSATPADTARMAHSPLPAADRPGWEEQHRSPFMAGALSFFVFAGAGHVYAGEYETAAVLVGTTVAGVYVAGRYGVQEHSSNSLLPVNGVFLAGVGVALGAVIYAHVDAPRAAARTNRRQARARHARITPALLHAPGSDQPGLTLLLSL